MFLLLPACGKDPLVGTWKESPLPSPLAAALASQFNQAASTHLTADDITGSVTFIFGGDKTVSNTLTAQLGNSGCTVTEALSGSYSETAAGTAQSFTMVFASGTLEVAGATCAAPSAKTSLPPAALGTTTNHYSISGDTLTVVNASTTTQLTRS